MSGQLLYQTTLPLMMFGTYVKKSTVVAGVDKNGKKKYKAKKEKTTLVPGVDKGIFPSVNTLYQTARNGSVSRTAIAKNHINLWKSIVESEWKELYKGPIYGTKLYLDCYFVFPDNRKRDTNNVLKMLPDALEGVIYDNDYFVLTRVQDFIVSDVGEAYLMIEVRKVDVSPDWMERLAK